MKRGDMMNASETIHPGSGKEKEVPTALPCAAREEPMLWDHGHDIPGHRRDDKEAVTVKLEPGHAPWWEYKWGHWW
jgi:hypothetical protein